MSTSDDFIKKYLGDTPTTRQKITAQQPAKTAAGSSAADAFINKYNPTVDESYINSFLSDWNSYASKQKTAYDGLDWKTATSYKSDEDGNDVFVHYTGIVKEGFKALTEGQLVSYEIGDGDKGVQAVNVQILPKAE